jgi:hypothetical protein
VLASPLTTADVKAQQHVASRPLAGSVSASNSAGCGAVRRGGENFVNAGSAGILDGYTIVEGHEYAEILTDSAPPHGWSSGFATDQENADECAWISSGQGAAANVTMGNGSYPMQSTWSNDTNRCDIAHVTVS